MPSKLAAIILAAGKGTRMKSDLPKVIHCINGKELLAFVIDAAQAVSAEKIVVVIGHQAEQVREAFANRGVFFAQQKEQLGTGHAVAQAKAEFENYDGDILILCGDAPLIREATLRAFYNYHLSLHADVTVMTALLDEPADYGRVVKSDTGEVLKIVEFRDATAQEKEIKEINSGVYCVKAQFLFEAITKISNNNKQGEYYLTDIIEHARRNEKKVFAFVIENFFEAMGINSTEELVLVAQYLSNDSNTKTQQAV